MHLMVSTRTLYAFYTHSNALHPTAAIEFATTVHLFCLLPMHPTFTSAKYCALKSMSSLLPLKQTKPQDYLHCSTGLLQCTEHKSTVRMIYKCRKHTGKGGKKGKEGKNKTIPNNWRIGGFGEIKIKAGLFFPLPLSP